MTDRALELCSFAPGARLVDLGCGSGAAVRYIAARYFVDIRGLDRDPAVVEGQSGLGCADAAALPLEDGSLDGVLMECSFSKMEDPPAVLAECRRVLKPDGLLALSDLYARGEPARLSGCAGRLDGVETLFRMLENAGFRIEHFEDRSEHLKALWGQLLLDRGAEALCREIGAEAVDFRRVKPGYFLLTARPKARPTDRTRGPGGPAKLDKGGKGITM